MSAVAVSLALRVLALFGVKLSPFKSGVLLAGGLSLAIAAGAIVAAKKIYDAGYEQSAAKCEAAALRSQLAAKDLDIKAANAAAGRADAARATLATKSEADRKRIAQYEQQLKARPKNAGCALRPDDFGGVRQDGKRRDSARP